MATQLIAVWTGPGERADAFPALRMRVGREQGRCMVPSCAVEWLSDAMTGSGGRIDVDTAKSTGRAVGGAR